MQKTTFLGYVSMRNNSLLRYLLAMFIFILSANGIWGATITYSGTVNWSSQSPASTDDVIIADGATVTIDTNVTVNSITVGQGTSGVLTFDGVAARAVVIAGDITVAAGGTFITQATGTFTNTLSIGGNITNNGTFDMSQSGSTLLCNVTFTKTGDQFIAGTTPVTTRFRGITLNKGALANKVSASINVDMNGSGLFVFTNGTWEQTAGILNVVGGNQTILSTGAISIINNASFSMLGSSPTVTGTLTVNTTGTVTVGSGNNSITNTSGIINFTAGTININGRLTMTSGTTTINGANIFIDQQVGTTLLGATSNALELGSAANFTFTSGSITIVDPNGSATNGGDARSGRDVKFPATTGTVIWTNGILYLGDGNSTSTAGNSGTGFIISGGTPLGNVVIQGGGITGRNVLINTNTTINGTLTMKSGSMTLTPTKAITYGTGATLAYNGNSIQTSTDVEFPSISGPTNLVVNNLNGVSLHAARTISGTLTLTAGKLSLGANNFTIPAGGSISGNTSTNYIVTDGAGNLTLNAGASTAVTFPIGASTTSYDPAILTPTTASDIAMNVQSSLPASSPAYYTYNAKVWNITPVSPSSTIVTLTPSTAVTSISSDVMGQYITDSYSNFSATKTGNAYTATFTTFAPFVTGTFDVGTAVNNASDSKLFVTVSDSQAMVNGTNSGDIISVYNMSGQKVKQITANSKLTFIKLDSGIYVIKVNTRISKVII